MDKLERIEVDLQYVSLYMYQTFINTLENHSQLLCDNDFANERLLVRQFDV